MDDFLKKFFPDVYTRKQKHLREADYCKYDNQILTLFTSSLYFGALVFTFGASFITKNKGRRVSMIWGSLCFLAGAAINAFAQNIAMLIIGRLLLGAGIGFSNQVRSMLPKIIPVISWLLICLKHSCSNHAGSSLVPVRNSSCECSWGS